MGTQEEERRAQLLGYFYEESTEGLEQMEASLLDLDVDQPGSDDIDAIFRAIHSIKGSGGSFGLDEISEFAHRAETVLDQVRAGPRELTQEVIDVLLHTCDCLTGMIEALRDSSDPDRARIDEVTRKLQAMLDDGTPESGAGEAPSGPARSAVSFGAGTWRIDFRPHLHLLRSGNEPIRIFRELADLGMLSVVTTIDELPTLAELEPEACYLLWDLELESEASEADVYEVFAWVEDDCDLDIEHQPAPGSTGVPDLEPGQSLEVDQTVPSAAPSTDATTAAATKTSSSIRVSTEKIDALVNMVGELVITQAMLGEVGEDFDMNRIDSLRDGLGQLKRNTREMQDSVMRIRMLPVSVTFNRFPRLVHDLSQKLGKQVELKITGEGTELDKNVLEKVADPLVHLIRNSLDHGLETPEERTTAGKPETATIHLDAFHQGGNIMIEVSDDGRGLDTEHIRSRAIERGLIGRGDALGEGQIHELLFCAGFSTAEQVSDVSGRGVGLDVVRRNVRELGGTVQVRSELGKGSTFTIRLPLTLAILDGQLVRVGSETFVVPLVSIVESLQIKPELVNRIAGRAEVYRLRDEAIPIVRLYGLFGVVPDRTDIKDGLLVVVEGGGAKAGILVDDLLGQQQVVIKSLEENYARVGGLSGATILGDGTVALIVDILGLIDLAKHRVPTLDDLAPGDLDAGEPESNFADDSDDLGEEIDSPPATVAQSDTHQSDQTDNPPSDEDGVQGECG